PQLAPGAAAARSAPEAARRRSRFGARAHGSRRRKPHGAREPSDALAGSSLHPEPARFFARGALTRLGHLDFEIERLAIAHHAQLELFAGLIGAQDACGVRTARGLAPVDRENHIAVLELVGLVFRCADDEHALLRTEIPAELRGER